MNIERDIYEAVKLSFIFDSGLNYSSWNKPIDLGDFLSESAWTPNSINFSRSSSHSISVPVTTWQMPTNGYFVNDLSQGMAAGLLPLVNYELVN